MWCLARDRAAVSQFWLMALRGILTPFLPWQFVPAHPDPRGFFPPGPKAIGEEPILAALTKQADLVLIVGPCWPSTYFVPATIGGIRYSICAKNVV